MTLRRALAASILLMGSAQTAEAHFVLLNPPSWTTENSFGDPQKAAPCGGENGTPTGIVTMYRTGETVTIRWQETIYHAGHWRIALAENRADLIDPEVSVDQNGVSTGATITEPPVAPIIYDNLFPRTSPSGSAGMMFEQDIVLPNTPCANCTLQVIQFMLGHGPPNYIYHHCADIQIVAEPPPDAGTPMDATVEVDAGGMDAGGMDAGPVDAAGGQDAAAAPDAAPGADAAPADANTASDGGGIAKDSGSGGGNDVSGGCGCTAHRARGSGSALLLLLLAAAFLVRRRSSG